MQDALMRLTGYWAGRGCLVGQPMNTEVGAGTLNPATALRVLGPEPWRVAYAEPSVRPDDARYGDNPNRLQTHTQFQVVLKPEPGDAQEQYLGSLAALGVDLRAHDVRFVEDDWASPALGAWGLGWEVWLDGLEITQFTYFQQSGGLTLDPVSVEITYGMERILMALQGVSHFKDIRYAPGVTYGEAFGQAEYEMSRYYLDDADIGAVRGLFEAYAGEARRMLDARLPVPAHTYVLKCSHAFNVLDSRGAIGTAERARAFARMRGLAHEVAGLWVERRAELGHPLGDASGRAAATAAAEPADAAEASPAALPEITGPGTFALEIGVEELPPNEVARTAREVADRLLRGLVEAGLLPAGSPLDAYATPRRIIVVAEGVEPREPDREEAVKGPRLAAAYGPDGAPTKALLGFARGHGVDPAGVGTVTVGGGEYAGYVRRVEGRPAAEVLAALLPGIVAGLRAGKNMRWNAAGASFARPIRGLLALLDEHVVPFAAAGLRSGRETRVHRTAERPAVPVASARDLVPTLRAHGIEPAAARRRAVIAETAGALARSAGGTVDLDGERALVDEVVDLVEEPVALLGSFDGGYLDLPEEILTTVMRKHQRYLPVRGPSGRLLPHFVAVANGECDHGAVRAGNEAVLRARYEDAAFFFQQDLRGTPEEMRDGLGTLTFTGRLGSMADRAERIRAIAAELADRAGLSGGDAAAVRRAGELAKFDLASAMVIELPGLAGTMAREYARRAGEDPAVAQALYEMELPRSAGDAPPAGTPGAVLAIADRLDLLAGLFAVGSAPTGGSDPFGLRRAALALTAVLRAHPALAPITVGGGLAVAARHQPVEVPPETLAEAERFVARRLEQALLDEGHAVSVVRAVLPHAGAPAHAERAAADLGGLLDEPRFQRLTAALQRVLRIVPEGTPAGYGPGLFQDPAEHRLDEAFTQVRAALPARPALPEFTAAALPLAAPIDAYFDAVMVMADDPAVRANRLGLLAAIRDLVDVLDWREVG
ncbi:MULTISPECIES: glycine--tRNA ligase [Actinomadura]|uniref:Multifunctional fusion protein n=1 Tax=Actinomadura yumaensis TaxID=111807 RepID=A0ABW2CRG3_9ACTN|nr:glycine--tRNA ligase [Actinomadura sp. J1-007]MWK32787.1 glycine--tRNA ligase [Actinomadura sp. J1-007]